MVKNIKEYKAILLKDKASTARVSVFAKDASHAKTLFEEKYGVGSVFNIYNEQDANRPR
jgi:hypothetical protein